MSKAISSGVAIAVIGSRGRMGRALTHLIEGEFSASCTLVAALHSQSDDREWRAALEADAWVDFSLPKSTTRLHSILTTTPAATRLPALVIGTTGHHAAENLLLEELAARTQVLKATNFSTGVLALKKALEFISPVLASSGFRPVMIESHHIHKKDAPSGTALTLAGATAGMEPEKIHSIRAGEVIGDHRIEFHGHGEIVSLEHHAQTRDIFARGALETALWLGRKHRSQPMASGWVTLDQYFEDHYFEEKLKCLK